MARIILETLGLSANDYGNPPQLRVDIIAYSDANRNIALTIDTSGSATQHIAVNLSRKNLKLIADHIYRQLEMTDKRKTLYSAFGSGNPTYADATIQDFLDEIERLSRYIAELNHQNRLSDEEIFQLGVATAKMTDLKTMILAEMNRL